MSSGLSASSLSVTIRPSLCSGRPRQNVPPLPGGLFLVHSRGFLARLWNAPWRVITRHDAADPRYRIIGNMGGYVHTLSYICADMGGSRMGIGRVIWSCRKLRPVMRMHQDRQLPCDPQRPEPPTAVLHTRIPDQGAPMPTTVCPRREPPGSASGSHDAAGDRDLTGTRHRGRHRPWRIQPSEWGTPYPDRVVTNQHRMAEWFEESRFELTVTRSDVKDDALL